MDRADLVRQERRQPARDDPRLGGAPKPHRRRGGTAAAAPLREASLEAVAAACGPPTSPAASTTEFTDEVINRVRSKLEVWSALGDVLSRLGAYLRGLDPRLPRSVWTMEAGGLAKRSATASPTRSRHLPAQRPRLLARDRGIGARHERGRRPRSGTARRCRGRPLRRVTLAARCS